METPNVFYLRSGDYLIGTFDELDEEPRIYLKESFRICDGKLERFPKYMEDNSCLLKTDLVITIGEPSPDILKAYIDATAPTTPDIKTISVTASVDTE